MDQAKYWKVVLLLVSAITAVTSQAKLKYMLEFVICLFWDLLCGFIFLFPFQCKYVKCMLVNMKKI